MIATMKVLVVVSQPIACYVPNRLEKKYFSTLFCSNSWYTVLQTVQMLGVYSAAYGTMKNP